MEEYRKAWRALVPRPHSEVLRWVDSMFEVKVQDMEPIRKRNGAVARENSEALAVLIMGLLEQGSWEVVNKGSTVNVIPLNLAPKPGAEPPWRLICNAIEVNKCAVGAWPVRYEGVHTLPMVLEDGAYGFTLDLKDGYYAMWLQEASRGVFGGEVVFSKE